MLRTFSKSTTRFPTLNFIVFFKSFIPIKNWLETLNYPLETINKHLSPWGKKCYHLQTIKFFWNVPLYSDISCVSIFILTFEEKIYVTFKPNLHWRIFFPNGLSF